MDIIEIEISNWDKYNPKRDQTSYSWLRLNNDFFLSPDTFDLTCEQKMIWVTLLCMASRESSAKFKVNVGYVAHHLRIESSAVVDAIDIFVTKGLATAGDRARPRGVAYSEDATAGDRARPPATARGRVVSRTQKTLPLRYERTNERTNDTNVGSFGGATAPLPALQDNPGLKLVQVYCEGWKTKYGGNPVVRGKEGKLLKSFGQEVGIAKASDMIRAFLGMPEPYFVQRRHDVVTFLNNLNAVTQFMQTGTVMTKAKMKLVEEKIDEVQGTHPSLKISDLLPDEPALEGAFE